MLLLLLLLLLLTAVELSLGGSSPYISTDKTNKNKYTFQPCVLGIIILYEYLGSDVLITSYLFQQQKITTLSQNLV